MNRNMARVLASTAAAAGETLRELEGSLTPGTLDPVIFGNYKVGYDTMGHNWAFSAIKATLQIPPCQEAEVNRADASIALLDYMASDYGVTFGVRCGGGPGSVRYYDMDHLPPTGGRVLADIAPEVGDSLQIEIFHNAEQNIDYGTATTFRKTPAGRLLLQRQVITSPAPAGVVVRHASLAVYINPGVATPHDVRLWKYSGIRVRSRNGTRGTLLGPWSTAPFVATKDGTADSHVLADTVLQDGGGTVSIWLRTTS